MRADTQNSLLGGQSGRPERPTKARQSGPKQAAKVDQSGPTGRPKLLHVEPLDCLAHFPRIGSTAQARERGDTRAIHTEHITLYQRVT